MPHVSNFKLNGATIPSVNTVTDALSKDGLIRNFYRKLGFKKADQVGGEARDQGIALAEAFEIYRKTGKYDKRKKYIAACIANWTKWFHASPYAIEADADVEPHLVSVKHGYHGSPDVILKSGTAYTLGDDKSKKRFSDYKLLMNEHAYAMCDHIELNGNLFPVKWEVPIRGFWFWTYHPETGELHPNKHEFDPQVFEDFLKCKAMYEVNKRAERYFGTHATLLPAA